MTKNKGIRTDAKHSSVTSTFANETAKTRLSINPALAEILHHATVLYALTRKYQDYLESQTIKDESQIHAILLANDCTGDALIQVSKAVGMDIAGQAFDKSDLL